MKLGIDIARRTGIALLDENNKVIKYIAKNVWDKDSIMQTCTNCYWLLKYFISNWTIDKVYCEVTEYSKSNIAHCLFGIISAFLTNNKKNITIIRFTANEWYKFIGNIRDKRDIRKSRSLHIANQILSRSFSKEFIINGLYMPLEDDDIADAINIAYYGPNCRSSNQAHYETLTKRKEHKKELRHKATRRKRVNYWKEEYKKAKKIGSIKRAEICKKNIERWKPKKGGE